MNYIVKDSHGALMFRENSGYDYHIATKLLKTLGKVDPSCVIPPAHFHLMIIRTGNKAVIGSM